MSLIFYLLTRLFVCLDNKYKFSDMEDDDENLTCGLKILKKAHTFIVYNSLLGMLIAA